MGLEVKGDEGRLTLTGLGEKSVVVMEGRRSGGKGRGLLSMGRTW